MNGFAVSDTGYFVYCNGDADREAFDGKLEFDIKLLPYRGDTSWIESTIQNIYETLSSSEIPEISEDCDFCLYVATVKGIEDY